MNKLTDAEIERLQKTGAEAVSCFTRMESLYKIKCKELEVAKSEVITALREKCIEHQDFHKGDDGVFRAYVSIEDLDNVISEM